MIQTFRKECAKYTYYQKHLHHLQLEYQEMEWKSYCVHSNDYEQKYDYRPVQYLSTVWLENKNKLEKEIQEIKAKIRWIETGFQCLEPSGDTYMLWQILVNKYPYTKMAEEMDICPTSLHRRVTNDLKKYLPKEKEESCPSS